jgi:hypothetical protein
MKPCFHKIKKPARHNGPGWRTHASCSDCTAENHREERGRPPPGGPVCMLVHDWSWGHARGGRQGWPACCSGRHGQGQHDHLWCRRSVAERGVRAHLVVMPSPALGHDLGLAQAVEDLTVEQSSSRSRALKLSRKPFSHRQSGGNRQRGCAFLHGLTYNSDVALIAFTSYLKEVDGR